MLQPGEKFDKTQLKSSMGYVHRDYLAHCFRWGFSTRFVNQTKTVLDIGCGQEMPWPKTMTHTPGTHPLIYVGCDYNRIIKRFGAGWVKGIYDKFDFTTRWNEILLEHGTFDIIGCFEVIEHMAPEDGKKLLAGAKALLGIEGRFFLSTPCFNGRQANNHVHEWTIPELQSAIEEAGLKVEARYGTFMNYNEAKKYAAPDELAVLKRLRFFYSDDILACFLAPLHPDHARNNIWILRQLEDQIVPQIKLKRD